MLREDLAALKRAAQVLDDNGREILAEQLWYVHDTELEKFPALPEPMDNPQDDLTVDMMQFDILPINVNGGSNA